MALGMFNTVTLAVNTPVQLTPPTGGHYTVYVLNGAGKLYISDQNNAGANATSFMVPAGMYLPGMPLSQNVWIASDTAGPVSVYFAPRG
jgi:hypothetical protein